MARDNEARLELTAIDSATEVIKGVQRSTQDLQAAYSKLAGIMGVSLGAGAFAAFVNSGIEAMASLRRLSDQTGVTVESLSALRTVAKLSGTDMDQVANGAAKLSKSMLEAAQTGTGKAASAFKALGVELTGSNGQLRDSDQVMQDVAKKLFDMENGTQRVAYAQELFGKSGAALLPFLRELAEAGALNAKVTGEQAEAAKRFEDNLIKLKAGTTTLGISLASDLLPSLNAVVGAMLLAKKLGDGFFATVGAGVAALFGGSDRHRNNKDLVEQTEKLLDLQNQMDLEKPGTTAYNAIKGQIADLKELMDTTTAYRKILDDVDAADAKRKQKSKTVIPLDIGGKVLGSGTGSAGLSPYEQQLNHLIDLQRKVESGGSIAAEMLHKLNAGDLGAVSDTDRKTMLDLAAKIEYMRQVAEGQKELTEGTKRLYEEQDRQNKQLETEAENYRKLGDPTRQYYQQIEQVHELVEKGKLTADEGSAAYTRLWTEIQKAAGGVKKTQDDMTQFTLQAARNMQSAMGTFFFDFMEGRMGNLTKSFLSMINRMVAEAAAAKLGGYLFGDFGNTNKVGGVAGDLLSSLGFGSSSGIGNNYAPGAYLTGDIPAFAMGTDYVPRTGLAVVHQGEKITPADENNSAGRNIAIHQNFQITGPVDRGSKQQIAAAALEGAQRALARNR